MGEIRDQRDIGRAIDAVAIHRSQDIELSDSPKCVWTDRFRARQKEGISVVNVVAKLKISDPIDGTSGGRAKYVG